MKKVVKIIAVVAGLALIALMSAVQATEAFEKAPFIILDGQVKSVDWSGKQLKVVFHSNDGYDGADWILSGPDPAYLLQMGWTKDVIKPGDGPSVVVVPNSDGTPRAKLLRFLLSDFRTLETGPYGFTQIYPPGALQQTYANPADDPLASNYGNTRTCLASDPKGPTEANYWCRLYVNADHTMMMIQSDLQKDGTWKQHVSTGVWWLEKQLNRTVSCTLINTLSKPRCHSPVDAHKVGDKWSIVFHAGDLSWTEYRELLPGRQ